MTVRQINKNALLSRVALAESDATCYTFKQNEV